MTRATPARLVQPSTKARWRSCRDRLCPVPSARRPTPDARRPTPDARRVFAGGDLFQAGNRRRTLATATVTMVLPGARQLRKLSSAGRTALSKVNGKLKGKQYEGMTWHEPTPYLSINPVRARHNRAAVGPKLRPMQATRGCVQVDGVQRGSVRTVVPTVTNARRVGQRGTLKGHPAWKRTACDESCDSVQAWPSQHAVAGSFI